MPSASGVGNMVIFKETVTKLLKVSDLKMPGALTLRSKRFVQKKGMRHLWGNSSPKSQSETMPKLAGVPVQCCKGCHWVQCRSKRDI